MKLLTATAITALMLGSAQAADIYNQGGSTKDGPGVFDAPQTVNWTGFYIGGSLGYGNANHNLTLQDYFKDYCANEGDTSVGFDEHGNLDNNAWKTVENKKTRFEGITGDTCETLAKEGSHSFPAGSHVTVPGDSRDIANLDGLNSHGIVGDVRLGADLQTGRFVLGVFGSYGFNGMETSGSITGLGGFDIEKGDEWSVGARAGILVNPRTLAYILAAYTQTEYDFSIHGGGEEESKTVDFSGITVGGGVEFAVTNNIFLGIEGTHTFYGEEAIFDEYEGGCGEYGCNNRGIRLLDEIGETKVMGTLKIKLNSGLPNFD